ncbi:50S ribosomal protein L5 [Methanospirillum hungatei]|jgi:large subunit ribosomal protein L5|uniref:50S ribosomal protein L5 n=1 Tax=Methanospirillum hungatei TaxID=2203 RepID=UPI0009C88574|nr:50S ribosomal protein L5 [Methanospirillum hungatei]MBP7034187.1 50S ribosomal protein L5 [Methanospirillum sp.]MBP9007071.1 50S ribosomal protein L5 [Methanospirillum sp.]OQA53844.1 MAG: 50S ribosomal protein L5 [Euryarchaeota archaeon ADurb.Bin294]HOW03679.1 50S ribosomal protein L5 [Methanospirillum hungatei]
MNPNRSVTVDKVVVHMGVGEAGDKLVNAERIISEITGNTPVRSVAKQTLPAFGIRKGAPISCRVTLRGEAAEKFLETSIKIVENKINSRAFDKQGNFSFGIEEHTDYPGQSYDPKVGIFGLDVTVVLKRNGVRIARRHIQQKKLPLKQQVTVEDAKLFLKDRYNVEVQ